MAHCILYRSVRYHEIAFITWLIQDDGTDDDGDDDDDDDDDDEDICIHLLFRYSSSDSFSRCHYINNELCDIGFKWYATQNM